MLSTTRQKIHCLVEEEDVEKRYSFFKIKIKQQKEDMTQRHLLRRQEVTPRRVRLVRRILETLKKSKFKYFFQQCLSILMW